MWIEPVRPSPEEIAATEEATGFQVPSQANVSEIQISSRLATREPNSRHVLVGLLEAMIIASVVGIPPMLVAGIYGMNFKGMPEYDWSYGYAYWLRQIALTALIPLAIFRWRKWI